MCNTAVESFKQVDLTEAYLKFSEIDSQLPKEQASKIAKVYSIEDDLVRHLFPEAVVTEEIKKNILPTLSENMSIIEFLTYFKDEETCYNFLEELRWDGQRVCPICGQSKTYKCKGLNYSCPKCKKYFTIKTKTLFSGSNLPLRLFLFNIFNNCTSRKSTSSAKIGKDLGVTQKTAWMLQARIRQAFEQEKIKLSGIVEIDEAFCGKGNKWSRWGAISPRKEPILGLIQRGGKVILRAVPDRKRETVNPIIEECVEHGSTIYTDGWVGYKKLPKHYKHDFVIHSEREYARGDVHTNTIENVWGFFKKSVRNAHHSISAKHLQRYLDEAAWKFNNRELSIKEKFVTIVSLCLSKELQKEEVLSGKVVEKVLKSNNKY